jgi:hypothetical protein
MVQGQQRQEVHKSLSHPIKKRGVVACPCHPTFAGNINRKITVLAGLDINMRPYSKNTCSKKGLKVWLKW